MIRIARRRPAMAVTPLEAVGCLGERLGAASINHDAPAALVERAGESKAEATEAPVTIPVGMDRMMHLQVHLKSRAGR